jgi:hypothetical protein
MSCVECGGGSKALIRPSLDHPPDGPAKYEWQSQPLYRRTRTTCIHETYFPLKVVEDAPALRAILPRCGTPDV